VFNLGKIIKFNKKSDNEKNNSNIIKDIETKENSTVKKLIKDDLKEAIENYLLTVFAIKNILDVDYVAEVNKSDVGFIGVISYEHKRKPGTFVADFIGQAVKEKNGNFRIIEIAFREGEPHLYSQIENILRAKNVHPVIKNK